MSFRLMMSVSKYGVFVDCPNHRTPLANLGVILLHAMIEPGSIVNQKPPTSKELPVAPKMTEIGWWHIKRIPSLSSRKRAAVLTLPLETLTGAVSYLTGTEEQLGTHITRPFLDGSYTCSDEEHSIISRALELLSGVYLERALGAAGVRGKCVVKKLCRAMRKFQKHYGQGLFLSTMDDQPLDEAPQVEAMFDHIALSHNVSYKDCKLSKALLRTWSRHAMMTVCLWIALKQVHLIERFVADLSQLQDAQVEAVSKKRNCVKWILKKFRSLHDATAGITPAEAPHT
eukprot:Blabericola_migrator_1__13105@NODE_891_length_6160_cov_27_099787_g627_i0_p3_GENE_NODE_891_length_6160_cov_27_099787_g627_i0NODE_891_length_6160_cov_27_099787_g627_i0_p3_ORF_typecomplete_len286_score26_21Vac14_Fig4_bd/PF11916_8/1_1e03Vac14_Fig4_bd/PF11916_8/0_18_NODE_891_length_6160_cov_27_099787_g627_i01701027